jgi:membrane fusion protein (multidrug efflux system)
MRWIRVGAAALLVGAAGGAVAAGEGAAAFSGKGMLRPEAELSLLAQVSGIVASVPRLEGDAIQPGEPVVVLDDAVQASALAVARCDLETVEVELRKVRVVRPEDLERARALHKEAEAAVAFAERSLESDKELNEHGALSALNLERSRRALDQATLALKSRALDLRLLEAGPRAEDVRLAELKVERQRLAVGQAERALALTRVSGVRKGRAFVGRILVQPGQWVDAQRTVADLIYMDRVRVDLDLPADVGLRVARGTKAVLRSDRYPGASLEGAVESSAPIIDAASGTVRVVIEAANPDLKMLPGAEVDVEIAAGGGK